MHPLDMQTESDKPAKGDKLDGGDGYAGKQGE
jgi:hypothetical protein